MLMNYQKDYKFVFEDGYTPTLQAKGKGRARILLSAFHPDRVGQTAIGCVEDEEDKTFKAKVEKL